MKLKRESRGRGWKSQPMASAERPTISINISMAHGLGSQVTSRTISKLCYRSSFYRGIADDGTRPYYHRDLKNSGFPVHPSPTPQVSRLRHLLIVHFQRVGAWLFYKNQHFLKSQNEALGVIITHFLKISQLVYMACFTENKHQLQA